MKNSAKHNRDLGSRGEHLAEEFLVSKGYHILERNFRTSHYELDLIAEHENILHFIEVKTRKSDSFGLAEDAISKKKIDSLLQAIHVYLSRYSAEPDWQLDLVVVEIKPKQDPSILFYQALGAMDGS